MNTSPETLRARGSSGVRNDQPPPQVSVVLPTWNRMDTLPRVLEALAAQARDAEFEVLVCDDGSTDGTPAFLGGKAASGDLPFPFRFVSLARNAGPARARNVAIGEARGDVVLFLGDDILPDDGLVGRHARWHHAHPRSEEALLGRTACPAELRGNPVLRWLEGDGRAFFFDYAGLPREASVGGRAFFTCHVSLKRALLSRTSLFDESFPFASHEDIELGHRLEREGMLLSYDPDAVGWHWHDLDLAATVLRIYRMGWSSIRYWQLVRDDSGRARRLARSVLRAAVAGSPTRSLLRAVVRREREVRSEALWLPLAHAAYWCGAGDAERGHVDDVLHGRAPAAGAGAAEPRG